MTDRDLLAGRGVVVVGGSRGIGRAVAELLARLGAGVVISGREPDAVRDATEAVISAGGRAAGIAGAADHEDTANALVDRCMTSFGRLDALINCAGIAEPPGSSILNISPAQFDGLLRAHLGTVFHTCRVAAPVLAAQGHGSIINTGSVAFLGDYGGSGYPAGKAAVNGLTLAISAELKARGVRANVICPGARTRLSSGPDYEAHINELHRRGLLDEMTRQASLDAPPADFVAPLYAYLASDLASGITGQIFVASGGFVGTFDRPTPRVLGWRDHRADPPWPVEDLRTMINARLLDTD